MKSSLNSVSSCLKVVDTRRNAYSALLFIAPTMLAAIVVVAILLQGFRRAFENFEDFKTFLITVESAFGIYVNILVFAIFDRVPKRKT